MAERHYGQRAAKFAALFVVLAGLGVAGPMLWQAVTDVPPTSDDAQSTTLDLVTAGGVRTITVEVAATPEAQAFGLMYRTELEDGHGMLFLHRAPREASMWMKNTYIPLDMVFIRADGTVHRIEANTEPHSERIITSNGDVAGVLELAGGAAARLGLKPGDKVRHPHFN